MRSFSARRSVDLLCCIEPIETIRLDRRGPKEHESARDTGRKSSDESSEKESTAQRKQKKLATHQHLGGVAEWSKAAVLKTAVPKGTRGSNPFSSASFAAMFLGGGEEVEGTTSVLREHRRPSGEMSAKSNRAMMKFRRCGLLIGAVLGAISMVARPADACTCPGSMLLSPQPSSTDVPLNAAIVFASWQTSVALFDRDRSIEVPATLEPFAGLARVWLIRPNQLLLPNTTYDVRSPLTTTGGTSFMTGTKTDDDPPSYIEITSFIAETGGPFSESCSASCLSRVGQRMKFDFASPPADTSLLLLEVRAADTTIVSTIPLSPYRQAPYWPRFHANSSCDFSGAMSFGPGEEICASISACPPPTPQNSCTWSLDCNARGDAGPDGAADAGVNDVSPPRLDSDGGCSMSKTAASPASLPQLLAAFATLAAFVRRRINRGSGTDRASQADGNTSARTRQTAADHPLRARGRRRSSAISTRPGPGARSSSDPSRWLRGLRAWVVRCWRVEGLRLLFRMFPQLSSSSSYRQHVSCR